MKRKKVAKKTSTNNFVALGGWILLCEAVGMLGSLFTIPQIQTWYPTLLKPSFSPPNWIFGPVWMLLYALMGFAAYRVWMLGIKKFAVRKVLLVFMFHLFLNFLWSFLFFGQHNIAGGFIEISLMWLLIAYLTVRFEKLDATSGYAMLPYFFWVSFALVLNYNIWILNA